MAIEPLQGAVGLVASVLALLATPGPTNTLLAASSAATGFRKSLPLLAAELLGYGVAIAVLVWALGPPAATSRPFAIALRICCGLFLSHAAWRLWRGAPAGIAGDSAIRFRDVLAATLLNPKALVLAVLITPLARSGGASLALGALLLGGSIASMGGVWLAIGASIRAGARVGVRTVYRAGAIVLGAFAMLILASALMV